MQLLTKAIVYRCSSKQVFLKKRIVVRNIHKRCSVKKDIVKKFHKFYRKAPMMESFPVKFAKILRTSFFTEHLLWLFLTTILFLQLLKTLKNQWFSNIFRSKAENQQFNFTSFNQSDHCNFCTVIITCEICRFHLKQA